MQDRISRYLLGNFSTVFFPLFNALLLIASVVLFVQISAMTSILKVTFGEMLSLYALALPEILLYTLPVSFFAAGVITLTKLSFDLELIVLFTLRANMGHILKPFLFLAVILSSALLVIGLWLKPKTWYKSKELIYQKEDSAQLNVKASEFGQKFGDWLLFIGKEKGDRLENVVLFTKDPEKEVFIRSGAARIENVENNFRLTLDQGNTFNIHRSKIDQVEFEKMIVNERAGLNRLDYQGVLAYWQDKLTSKKKKKDLAQTILIALFPLLSLVMIVATGIINPRYQKNRSYLYIIGGTLYYYLLVFTVAAPLPFASLAVVPAVWLGSSYLLYRKRVRPIY